MKNFVTLQNFLTHGLLSCEALANVQVRQYRKLRMESEIDYTSLYGSPREGQHRAGCGLLVEMPVFEVHSPNVSGPVGDLVCPVLVMEEPNLNMEQQTGTLVSAEEAAMEVLNHCHQWPIGGAGTFYAAPNAIQEAEELQPGLVCYRVRLKVKVARQQTKRSALPTVTEQQLLVMMTPVTEGSEIYYTTDGGFPGPSNPGAHRYVGPFMASGDVLYYAAFKAGMLMSEVGRLDRAQ